MTTTDKQTASAAAGKAASDAVSRVLATESDAPFPRKTKQQERAENVQRRQDLQTKVNGDPLPISRDIDIDHPLTNPAAKQREGRIQQDAEGKFAKPFPADSNLSAAPSTIAAEPKAQTDEEFQSTGGEKALETADVKPDTGPETPIEQSVKEAQDREKTAATNADTSAKTAKAEDKKK